MSFTQADNKRLKLLTLIEKAGTVALKHVLECGTHNTESVDLDCYLEAHRPKSPVRLLRFRNTPRKYHMFSNTQKRTLFTKSESYMMRNNPSWNFDITLLHKAIRIACEGLAHEHDPVWSYPNELEGLVTKIKNMRNETIHSLQPMSDHEFNGSVTEVEDLCLRILEAVQLKYSVPAAVTRRLKDEVRSYTYDITHSEDLLSDLDISREQLTMLMNMHLRRIFEEDQFINPFSSFSDSSETQISIQRIFSKLRLKTKRELDCWDLLSLLQPPQHTFSSTQAGTQPPTPSQVSFPPKLLVVSGEAGSGKTTLLNFITSEWIKNETERRIKYLETYELVLPIFCREKTVVSLYDLVDQAVPEFFKGKKVNVMSLVRDCRVLFLIDDIDQVNDQLVQDILRHCKKCPGFSAVCTIRPENVQNFYDSVPEICSKREVSITGVAIADRIDLVMKYYECCAPDPREANELTQLMDEVCIWEHFRLPLYLVFLVNLFLNGPDCRASSYTKSNYHLTMRKWHENKLLSKYLKTNEQTDRQVCEEKIKHVMNVIDKVALRDLLENTQDLSMFDVLELTECCEEQALPINELVGPFLSLRKCNKAGTANQVYYIPQSDQEFFAAFHIVRLIHAGSTAGDIKRLLQNSQETQQPRNITTHRDLLMTVASLLTHSGALTSSRAIEEIVDTLAETQMTCNKWLFLLANSRNNDAILRRVAYHVKDNSLDDGEEITVKNITLLSASALLPLVQHKQILFELNWETRGLYEAFRALAGHTCTALSLHHHYKNQGPAASSGNLLHNLPDRSHLTIFMGHLDAEHLSLLPQSLLELCLVLVDFWHALSLLPALKQVHEKFPNLLDLYVHIHVLKVPSDYLEPLPGFKKPRVHLVLSGLAEGEVNTAGKVAAAMYPRETGYATISFPGASLLVDGWRQVVHQLAEEKIKISNGIWIPETDISSTEMTGLIELAESVLGCQIEVATEDAIWDTY